MLRDVAVLVDGEAHPFEIGIASEVFGVDRSAAGVPRFAFAVCSANSEPVPALGGLTVSGRHNLDLLASADLIVLPAWRTDGAAAPTRIHDAIWAAMTRGASVLAICSGAFLLADAGVLDGRRATCHWAHADLLAERYPTVTVERELLYVEDGPLVTSAGSAAGVDAALHVVRREHGATVANTIAQHMALPPQRAGKQAQYIETPVPGPHAPDIPALLADIQTDLARSYPVAELAARMGSSPRTFARHFHATTGTSPNAWITRQRVIQAQRILESDPTITIETLARRCGFTGADLLRHHFRAQLGRSPHAYRNWHQDHAGVGDS